MFVSLTTESKLSGDFLLHNYLCSPGGSPRSRWLCFTNTDPEQYGKRAGVKNHYQKEIPVRKTQAKAGET